MKNATVVVLVVAVWAGMFGAVTARLGTLPGSLAKIELDEAMERRVVDRFPSALEHSSRPVDKSPD